MRPRDKEGFREEGAGAVAGITAAAAVAAAVGLGGLFAMAAAALGFLHDFVHDFVHEAHFGGLCKVYCSGKLIEVGNVVE